MTARSARLIGVLIAIATALVGQTSVRVNVGGPTYTDSNGLTWAADSGCDGSTFTSGNTISGTLDPTLYQTGRIAQNFSCVYTVTGPAFYNVTVRFAETNSVISVRNPRIFNVFINNVFKQTVNIVGSGSAANTATDYTFGPIPVYGTTVTILFTSVANASEVQAIDIENTGTIGSQTSQTIYDSNGHVVAGIDQYGAIYTRSGSDNKKKQGITAANGPNGNGFNASSDTYSCWNSTDNLDTGADDVCLVRAAAGVIQVVKGYLSTDPGGLLLESIQLNPGADSRPACVVGSRGLFWQTFGTAGVADTVAVCAKDNTDTYAWRTIY